MRYINRRALKKTRINLLEMSIKDIIKEGNAYYGGDFYDRGYAAEMFAEADYYKEILNHLKKDYKEFKFSIIRDIFYTFISFLLVAGACTILILSL